MQHGGAESAETATEGTRELEHTLKFFCNLRGCLRALRASVLHWTRPETTSGRTEVVRPRGVSISNLGSKIQRADVVEAMTGGWGSLRIMPTLMAAGFSPIADLLAS
jgi:hypothetical protein